MTRRPSNVLTVMMAALVIAGLLGLVFVAWRSAGVALLKVGTLLC